MEPLEKEHHRDVKTLHEKKMAGGQENYFSMDNDCQIEANPDQYEWLHIHRIKIEKLLALQPGEIFVDLGCGEGYHTFHLSQQPRFSIGIDFSASALEVLIKQRAFDPIKLGLLNSTAGNLPIQTASINKVLCNHVLEHVIDDRAVIRDIHRILSPGGRLLVGVPLAFTPLINVAIRFRRLLFPRSRKLQLEKVQPGQLVPELIGVQPHIRFYSLATLKKLFQMNGFRIIKSEGIGLGMPTDLRRKIRRNKWSIHLGTGLSTIFPSLGDGVLILAEKQ